MKTFTLFGLIILNYSYLLAQNVGIGQANPASKLDINGNLTIGSGYSATAAPTNGVIIEGNVGIGTNNPGTNRLQVTGGSIFFDGDFLNQGITGNVTSVGSAAVDDANATQVTVPSVGAATAAQNWLPGYSTGGNTTQACAVCNMSYNQTLPTSIGFSEVVQGTNITVTIADGSGVNYSGVVIMANVIIKSTNNATSLGTNVRYVLWLQRSTDNFATNGTNIYKIEDAIASGVNNIPNPPTLGSGISTSTIVFPDLTLSAGTYYYRIVYQNIMGATNGQTLFVQDRSMVALQVKQ